MTAPHHGDRASEPGRCPRCGAVQRGGGWCWLCQADLRGMPAAVVPAAGAPAASPVGPPPVAGTQVGPAVAAPSGTVTPVPLAAPPPSPEHRVDLLPPPGVPGPESAAATPAAGPTVPVAGPDDADVAAMLAALRAQESDAVGRVAERVPDRGRRMLLAGVAVVLLVLVVLLVTTVLGGLLG